MDLHTPRQAKDFQYNTPGTIEKPKPDALLKLGLPVELCVQCASAAMLQRLLKLILATLRAPRVRRQAIQALEIGRADLEIDWPVSLRWRKDLDGLGRASSRMKYEIEIRPRQDPQEAMRTVFHELYHLAQFHKWGDLHPRKRKINAGDLERAESLAEIYARVTAKSLQRSSRRARKGR